MSTNEVPATAGAMTPEMVELFFQCYPSMRALVQTVDGREVWERPAVEAFVVWATGMSLMSMLGQVSDVGQLQTDLQGILNRAAGRGPTVN